MASAALMGVSALLAASALLVVPTAAFVPRAPPRARDFRPASARRSAVVMQGMALPVGSLVALATPMTDDGAVDVPTLRELLRWHITEGTDGVVILGTTGEASCLSAEEKGEVMAVTRDEIGGKVPIVVGVGTIDTPSVIAATKQAKLFGADAALVVTPYYVKPSQAGLLAHFNAIADASDLPIVLYNVPGRTGVDLSIETTVALSRHPNIAGLKDATGDNNRVAPMRRICGDDFRLYSGEDAMARDYVLQGGDGVISVTANVAPATMSKMMAAANADDAKAASMLDAPLAALHRDLFCEANPIPVKWALHKMGRTAQGGIRLPLVPLGVDFHGRVEAALAQASCLSQPESDSTASFGWPSRDILLQGHLFDASLINQALEIIEKRGGDFEITAFSVQPNDQSSNADFNFRRPSSVAIKVFGVDESALDDIIGRLQNLVDVIESAEGTLTVVPDAA